MEGFTIVLWSLGIGFALFNHAVADWLHEEQWRCFIGQPARDRPWHVRAWQHVFARNEKIPDKKD